MTKIGLSIKIKATEKVKKLHTLKASMDLIRVYALSHFTFPQISLKEVCLIKSEEESKGSKRRYLLKSGTMGAFNASKTFIYV